VCTFAHKPVRKTAEAGGLFACRLKPRAGINRLIRMGDHILDSHLRRIHTGLLTILLIGWLSIR